MFKKLFSLFLCILCLCCAFSVSTAAARTGEFETQDVEFQAFVSSGVVAPIEIKLTHVTDKYELYYYLYSKNEYFSNDPVALGEYSVEVTVGGDEATDFDYVYDKKLKVEPASTAIKFTIIADQVLESGDYSGSVVLPSDVSSESEPTDYDDPTDLFTDIKEDDGQEEASSDASADDSTHGQGEAKSSHSLLISLVISLLVLVVIAFVLWKIKNR